MISIIYRTYRPGGFDILADSLRNQTMQDYELIVVDDYKPDRKKIIKDYLVEQNVNIAHVESSKEKCFPWLPFNQNNQINTGILLSKGDTIIIYDDYTWVPPDHLEKFLQRSMLNENCCITPVNRMLVDHRKRNNEGLISIYDTPQIGSPLMNNCTFDFWHIPEKFEVGGTAFPRGLIEKVNGFPEYYDLYPSGLWRGIYKKMEEKAANFFVDRNIVTEMINHRGWEPVELWHCAHMTKQAKYNSTAQAEHDIEMENCFKLTPGGL